MNTATIANLIATGFDIGPNMLALGLAIIAVWQLIVNGHQTKASKEAAEAASKQLQPNGGSSIADKINRIEARQLGNYSALLDGQEQIQRTLETHSARLDKIDPQ